MSVFPVIAVKDYQVSSKFYTEKLGFTELFSMSPVGPDGQEHPFGMFAMGESTNLMLGHDADLTERGKGIVLMFYPDGDFDVDAHYELLKSRGVAIDTELKTEYWGDRTFTLTDPDGYVLTFAKTVEQVSPEEAMERLKNAAE